MSFQMEAIEHIYLSNNNGDNMNKDDKFYKMGLASNADIKNILSTEYSERFDNIRKNMMVMSYYKYGPLKDNYGKYKCMNAIENLKIRLQKYLDTGNTEYLADVANFAMLEFMNPSIEGAKYKPTDNPDCEISGFSINEIRNFNGEKELKVYEHYE